MPTYDFRCSACSTSFEAVLPFGSKSKPSCPTCKSKKTEKQISPPTIHFKGDGFFVTDSQKKPSTEKKPEAEKKTEKPTAGPPKTETTTSKPKP